jgi:hypothetical protein
MNLKIQSINIHRQKEQNGLATIQVNVFLTAHRSGGQL